MPSNPSPANPSIVLARLRKLLFALLQQNGITQYESAEMIPEDVDLSMIGINSIDFLEFALMVETHFSVAILDTIEPDELPMTLGAWQRLLAARSTSL